MLVALCYLFLTYLLAAVPFGLVITTLYGGDEDIRVEGSGNIGATNVARVHGSGLAAVVLAFDVAKGLGPVVVADVLFPEAGVAWLGAVALTAFLGHCYPVYLAFHGGKGVATGAGAMLGLAPAPTGAAVATWILVLAVTGRSSVASLIATVVLVATSLWWAPAVWPVALVLAVGIVHAHVANIRRLVAGDEKAILRPVRWGRAADGDAVDDVAAVLRAGPAGQEVAPEVWPGADTA